SIHQCHERPQGHRTDGIAKHRTACAASCRPGGASKRRNRQMAHRHPGERHGAATMTSAARATPGRGPLAYRLDDFTDGWVEDAPHVMLLHGIAESAEAFNGWVPHLSRRWPVLRPDLRGHGQSPAVRDGDRLTISGLADDIEQLVAGIALKHIHVMGAKLGAQVALELAQRRLPWMASLSLAGVLISPSAALAQWIPDWLKLVDEQGVAGWARATMPGRMGSALPPEGYAWWIQYMANTRPET